MQASANYDAPLLRRSVFRTTYASAHFTKCSSWIFSFRLNDCLLHQLPGSVAVAAVRCAHIAVDRVRALDNDVATLFGGGGAVRGSAAATSRVASAASSASMPDEPLRLIGGDLIHIEISSDSSSPSPSPTLIATWFERAHHALRVRFNHPRDAALSQVPLTQHVTVDKRTHLGCGISLPAKLFCLFFFPLVSSSFILF